MKIKCYKCAHEFKKERVGIYFIQCPFCKGKLLPSKLTRLGNITPENSKERLIIELWK